MTGRPWPARGNDDPRPDRGQSGKGAAFFRNLAAGFALLNNEKILLMTTLKTNRVIRKIYRNRREEVN